MVVPSLFDWPLFVFHLILGSFVLINLIGNFIGIMVIDTSTKSHVLPSQVCNNLLFDIFKEERLFMCF